MTIRCVLLTSRMPKKSHYRTIWISDVHLATQDCNAEALRSFLKNHTCDTLYLVGDIIDGWAIRANGWYWPSEHNQVARQILRKAEKEGTKVWYIAGNHDEFLRDYLPEHRLILGNIEVVDEKEHIAADGKRILCLHGDRHDILMTHHKALEKISDFGYVLIMSANRLWDKVRRKLGFPKVSLMAFFKRQIHLVKNFQGKFERSVSEEASRQHFDGVICGHIHKPFYNKNLNGVKYWNTGDWVEHCSAIVEDDKGKLSVVEWDETHLQNEKSVYGLKVLFEEE